MNKSESRNSDTDNKNVGVIAKSVSALGAHFDEDQSQLSHDSVPKGVSINNFDSLMGQMASLNIKFFHD